MSVFLSRGVIMLIAILGVARAQSNEPEFSDPQVVVSIEKALLNQFKELQSIKFTCDSNLTLSDAFLTAYPKYKERATITSHLQFTTSGQEYHYDEKTIEPSGKINSDVEGAYDGKDTQTLIRANTSILVLHHKFIRELHGAFAGKSIVFLPFCFLPKDFDADGYSVITLADLQSPESWAALLKRGANIQIEGSSPNRTAKITFRSNLGYTDDVIFTEANGWNPQMVTRTEDKIGKRFEITVDTFASLKLKNGLYWYPSSVRFTYYGLGAKKFFDSNLKLTSLSVNKELSDEGFKIDPSQADLIEDKDKNVTIDVPK